MINFRTMAERCLRHRLQGITSNAGPSVTAGPVPLTTTQCCMHRPGVKCVQANTCLCRAANCPCMSGRPSEICRNQGPTRPLLYQVSLPTLVKTLRRPNKPPQPSIRPPPWLSFTKTHRRSHPASSWEEQSGLPYRRAMTQPTRPHLSMRPLILTPPHWRLSGVAKEIQITHDQKWSNIAPHSTWRPW